MKLSYFGVRVKIISMMVGIFSFLYLFCSLPVYSSLEQTLLIKPHYLDVTEVGDLLPQDLLQYVRFDAQRNLILIAAPAPVMQRIENIISSNDRVPVQIMLQVTATEIIREKGSQMDIDWNWWWVEDREATEAVSVEALAIGYTSENIEATITSLARKGEAKIISNPRVVTLNDREAKVEFSTEKYFQIIAGSADESYYTVEPVVATTHIGVEPHLTKSRDEVILGMRVAVEDINIESEVPRVVRRSATTRLRVPIGETVAIAGLSQQVQREVRRKVKGLGDVPVVEVLFSSRQSSRTETELAIFVTPYLVGEEIPQTDTALTAASWNTWNNPSTRSFEYKQFKPRFSLSFAGFLDETGDERRYHGEIGYQPAYTWGLRAGYGTVQADYYKLTYYNAGFHSRIVQLRENLYINLNYKQREGDFTKNSSKEDFQQNQYSVSLKEINSLSPRLQLSGEVGLVYVEDEKRGPPITFLSGGPVYHLGAGWSIFGDYHYIWSKEDKYQQKGYIAGLRYSSLGGFLTLTAGYQETDQKDIRYMINMDPPSKGYYVSTKLTF